LSNQAQTISLTFLDGGLTGVLDLADNIFQQMVALSPAG
jgi:hypothetical protein